MTIANPTSAQYPSAQTSYQPAVSRLQRDVSNLSGDLASGDLKGAQRSFADLAKLLQSNGVVSSSSATPSNSPASAFSSTLQNDFQQLGQDLSNGNLAGAQKDFSQLTSDAASEQQASSQSTAPAGGHHHHHHHQADSSTDSGNDSSTTQPTTLQSDFNQLGQDISSGNFSAVQQDFSHLTSDLGTSGASNSYISFSYTSTTQTINFIG